MDKEQKELKLALNALCTECGQPCREGNKYCGRVACRVQAYYRRKIEAPIKAEAAGEAQKSIAQEALDQLEHIKNSIEYLENTMKELLK